jgi:hypothetical protein
VRLVALLRGVAASILSISLLSSPSFAVCGERGGPGCRLPNGRCASWAQADYCRTHPEAVEAPAPELDQGAKVNPLVRGSLLAMPTGTGAIMLQLDPTEMAAVDQWIARQPDPKPSRQEAVHRLIAQALRER